jgi:uncharacterized protein involved in response to NO
MLSATPLRLLTFGAGLHTAVWAVLLAGDCLSATQFAQGIFAFSLIYGLLGAVLLGYLLTNLPKWVGRAPIHYGWYAGAYLALLFGLMLMEAGLFLGASWAVSGSVLVLSAWGLGFRALGWEREWASGRIRPVIDLFMGSLAIGLGAIVIFAIGLAADWPRAIQLGVHAGFWLVLLPSLASFGLIAWLKGVPFLLQGRGTTR